MAQFIDVYQPWPMRKAKTVSDEFTLPIEWALLMSRRVWSLMQKHGCSHTSVQHRWQEVPSVLQPRNELLPYFLAADRARLCIAHMGYAGGDRKIVIDLVG